MGAHRTSLLLMALVISTAVVTAAHISPEGVLQEVSDNGVEAGGAAVGAAPGARSVESAVAECSVNGTTTESRLACFGARLLSGAVDALLARKRYRLSEGVEIVDVGGGERGGRMMEQGSGNSVSDVLRKIRSFLRSRELRLRLPRLSSLPLDWRSLFDNETMPGALEILNRVGFTRQVMWPEEGRGKNKGGGALAAAMLMSAATIGAVGLKGIGLLALKALALSSAAFVLSLVAALKKLVSKDDEGGGGHYVQYVPLHHSSGHHRRSLDIPYWAHATPQAAA
ncbi:uncharacterized protein LOC124154696 [Ischnura elegans]|uniref:uncharacterized protein LOC124154696 n=1 Tax=Ischnura elegans TaxID=197161 RepID=UPI001ED88375|nr:uncharacterized protein LOC124154696 [Ischnura elegans]